MPIHLSWNNPEKTIILWEFVDRWNWQDYHAAVNRGVMMIKSVDHTVYSILDLRRNNGVPVGALVQGPRWFIVAPPNFGFAIVCGADPLVRKIAETIIRVNQHYSRKIRFADSMEAAVALIAASEPPSSP